MPSSIGKLKINVTSEINGYPVSGADIRISYTGIPDNILEETSTDSSGQTETLELDAPPVEYSLDVNSDEQPYSEYTILASAPGFETVSIAGAEILGDVTAIQNIRMRPSDSTDRREERFVIPAHTLYGNYPPKIPEDEIKPVNETGEIVLSRVVVPEYIVVHDGSPRDSTARNYYVKYKDYIKNVASSEIYATWPANTIRANVLAIMSFTLNRVYTEWYRNQGYDFTITSSTAFDHKWIPERNVYDTISVIVDELFADYLSRPNVRQPILTQYCDGRQVQCPNWMTILQGHIKHFLPYIN
nr:carboxypeptidase-like regulatory domain-containing protein [uncultured Lachnoclostridium sp.]